MFSNRLHRDSTNCLEPLQNKSETTRIPQDLFISRTQTGVMSLEQSVCKDRINSGPVHIPQDSRFNIEMDLLFSAQDFWSLIKEHFKLSIVPTNKKYLIQTLQTVAFNCTEKNRFNNCYAFTSSQFSQFINLFHVAFYCDSRSGVNLQLRFIQNKQHYSCDFRLTVDLDYENQMVYLKNSDCHKHNHAIESTLELCGITSSDDLSFLKPSKDNTIQWRTTRVNSELLKTKTALESSTSNSHHLASNKTEEITVPRRFSHLSGAIKVGISTDNQFLININQSTSFRKFWKSIQVHKNDRVKRHHFNQIRETLKDIMMDSTQVLKTGQVPSTSNDKIYEFTTSQFCQFVIFFNNGISRGVGADLDYSVFYINMSIWKMGTIPIKTKYALDHVLQKVYLMKVTETSNENALHLFLNRMVS